MADGVIDMVVFAELKDTMGADFAAELVTTFLHEAPAMLADLAKAAQDRDDDGFRRAAHSIKSNANIFGATELAELARQMELNGPAPGAVAAIKAEYTRTENSLRDLVDG